jgi:hypothetical protein
MWISVESEKPDEPVPHERYALGCKSGSGIEGKSGSGFKIHKLQRLKTEP